MVVFYAVALGIFLVIRLDRQPVLLGGFFPWLILMIEGRVVAAVNPEGAASFLWVVSLFLGLPFCWGCAGLVFLGKRIFAHIATLIETLN